VKSQWMSATKNEICEVLTVLELSFASRKRLADEAVGMKEPPAWLNPRVTTVARELGYIEEVPIIGKSPPGRMVTTRMSGKQVYEIVITDKGRMLLEEQRMFLEERR
jgi:hypothetical protein